jgi:hypothetical protein
MVGALALSACGSDSGGDADASVIVTVDAGIPDASLPDAFVCVETETKKACGPGREGCVDITRENAHCGGCTMACASPGQACVPGPEGEGTEIAHCECPPMDFVPAVITPLDLSQFGVDPVNPAGADHIGFGIYIGDGSLAHAFLVTFNLTDGTATPIGEDIDLAAVPSTATAPRVGAGYNVDLQSQNLQTPYAASAGTLNLDYACATGVAGTVTNATFIEVEASTNPVPVPNGCGFSLDTVSFAFGDDCDTTPDAGI